MSSPQSPGATHVSSSPNNSPLIKEHDDHISRDYNNNMKDAAAAPPSRRGQHSGGVGAASDGIVSNHGDDAAQNHIIRNGMGPHMNGKQAYADSRLELPSQSHLAAAAPSLNSDNSTDSTMSPPPQSSSDSSQPSDVSPNNDNHNAERNQQPKGKQYHTRQQHQESLASDKLELSTTTTSVTTSAKQQHHLLPFTKNHKHPANANKNNNNTKESVDNHSHSTHHVSQFVRSSLANVVNKLHHHTATSHQQNHNSASAAAKEQNSDETSLHNTTSDAITTTTKTTSSPNHPHKRQSPLAPSSLKNSSPSNLILHQIHTTFSGSDNSPTFHSEPNVDQIGLAPPRIAVPSHHPAPALPSTTFLVHLSDIHLHPPKKFLSQDLEDPHTWKRYQGLLNVKYGRGNGDLNKLDEMKRVLEKAFSLNRCHFIVTGDLTNVSLRAEFDFCYQELKRLFLSEDNLTVIPGNHDMYVEKAKSRFIQYYHSLCWKEGEEREFPFIKQLDNGEDSSIILIGFNSGVPTKLFVAAGEVDEAQIDRARRDLKRLLERDTRKNHLLVALIHHPPQKRFNKIIEWMGMLDDRSKRRIQDFCKEFNIHVILNGHTHDPYVALLPDSDTLSIDCGSTTMNSSKEKTCFFNVYQVQGVRFVKAWQYSWCAKEATFKGSRLELPDCAVTRNPQEMSNSSFYSTECDSDQDGEEEETSRSPFSMMMSTNIKIDPAGEGY